MSVVRRDGIGCTFLRGGVCWALAGLLVGAGARGAAAQAVDGPISLRWEAPEGCPAREAVLGEIEHLLGGAPAPDSGRRLLARGKVTRDGQGSFRLVLRTERDDGGGERKISAASCETLADAAALVIALAFDPVAVVLQSQREEELKEGAPRADARPAAEASAGAPSLGSAAGGGGAGGTGGAGGAGNAVAAPGLGAGAVSDGVAAPPPLPAWPVLLPIPDRPLEPLVPVWGPASDRARPHPPGVGLGAGLGVDVGSFDGTSVQMNAWMAWLLHPYRLEGRFTLLPDSDAEVPGRAGTGGRFRLLSGSLIGCRVLLPWRSSRPARVELGGCAAAELGWIEAEGYGVLSPGEGGSLWLALHAKAELSVRLGGPLHLRLEAGAGVPFIRRAFVLEQVGEVHTPSPVVGRAAGEVALQF